MLGVEDFLDSKLKAYNQAAEAIQNKEKAKEIEKNRPAPPTKTNPETKSANIELKRKDTPKINSDKKTKP